LEKLLATIPDKDEIQVIVIDDYSEKQHLVEIDKLKDKYSFEFYENDGVKSAGTCRNIGLEKAKGDWVLFADSDDYFTDGFYDIVSNYFDGQSDVVYFNSTSIYIDTGETADRHKMYDKLIFDYLETKSLKHELIIRYTYSSICFRLIKRSFVEKNNIRFDEIIASNDVIFSAKVGYYMNSFEICPEVIYCITRNSKSLTSNRSVEIFNLRRKASIDRLIFLKNKLNNNEFKLLSPKLTAELLYQSLVRYGFSKLIETKNLLQKSNLQWFYIQYFEVDNFIIALKNSWRNFFINRKYFSK
jgi:glycosyltransferase involved in cell wall biosynthesis